MLLSTETLPDFQNFNYEIAVTPTGARLRAWDRARACERRLAMYLWVEGCNDWNEPDLIVWLDDEVGAFLLVYESVIQFLGEQYELKFGSNSFGQWFATQPENDSVVRGLRTLRHFEAHVESQPVAGNVTIDLGVPTAAGNPTVTRRWSLQPLLEKDLQRLKNPQLKKASEIADWNQYVYQVDNRDLFAHGLPQLVSIIARAESIL